MYIRLVQFNLGAGKRSVAESIADKVVPVIRAQPGIISCEFIMDEVTGDYGIVVRWKSKEAADAAYPVLSPIVIPTITAAKGTPNIRLFEVYEPK
jgi:hypothetical protein